MANTTQEIELHKMPYDLYLKTKHWKAFRLKALHQLGRKCMMCDTDETKILHVHHLTYKNLGHESMEDVIILCPVCHKAIHNASFEVKQQQLKKPKKMIKRRPWKNKKPKKKRDPISDYSWKEPNEIEKRYLAKLQANKKEAKIDPYLHLREGR